MSWYQTGNDGRKRSKLEDEMARKRKEQSGIWRFYQKNSETAKIVFLDTPSFFYHEHSLFNLTGKMDAATCIKDSDEGVCPLCEYGNPSYCVAGTIIDTRESESTKDGKTTLYKNQKRLFVAKGKAREVILRRSEEQKHDLRGAVFSISRGAGTKECSTGEDIQYLGKVTDEKLMKLLPEGQKFEDWSKPFDYAKILKPMSAVQLRQLSGGKAPVGSDEDILGDDLETDGGSPLDDEAVGGIDDLL